MENISYYPNPVPENADDLRRYLDDEFHRIRDALDITPRWDDLRFPSQGIRITGPGGAWPPDTDTTTALLLFDGGRTEMIGGVAQLPHAWKEYSTVKPHVHWSKTTTGGGGDVRWVIDYEVWNNGDVSTLTYSNQLVVTSSVAGTPDNDTANELLISSFGDIDMTGIEASGMIFWRISREGGDAADTYSADARLIEFDIHYEVDSFGSSREFVKL